MKIKSLAALCKRHKRFYLYDIQNGAQWLGDGSAIYPLLKMPTITKENIFVLFDIPEKQQEKIHITVDKLPSHINFNDNTEFENMLDSENITIGYAGRVLRPLRTSQGIVFLDTKYLEPLGDIVDAVELFERIDGNSRPYIVAKMGFVLVAVIMPYDVIKDDFVKQLQDLTKHCSYALAVNKERAIKSGVGSVDVNITMEGS